MDREIIQPAGRWFSWCWYHLYNMCFKQQVDWMMVFHKNITSGISISVDISGSLHDPMLLSRSGARRETSVLDVVKNIPICSTFLFFQQWIDRSWLLVQSPIVTIRSSLWIFSWYLPVSAKFNRKHLDEQGKPCKIMVLYGVLLNKQAIPVSSDFRWEKNLRDFCLVIPQVGDDLSSMASDLEDDEEERGVSDRGWFFTSKNGATNCELEESSICIWLVVSNIVYFPYGIILPID
jgi:hypothetical protein